MKTLRSETIGLLAAGLVATAVHAGPGVHAAGQSGQSGGMGMMQERGSMEHNGPMQMMGGEMMGGMRQMQRAMQELDLTNQQRAELRTLRQAHRETHFERMARMMNLREDLHALMASEQPDPREVQAQHGRMAEIHGEMLAEQVRLRNSMQQLLTQEQRRELQRRTSAGQASESSDQEGHEAHH